jgi:hypothetical protein
MWQKWLQTMERDCALVVVSMSIVCLSNPCIVERMNVTNHSLVVFSILRSVIVDISSQKTAAAELRRTGKKRKKSTIGQQQHSQKSPNEDE